MYSRSFSCSTRFVISNSSRQFSNDAIMLHYYDATGIRERGGGREEIPERMLHPATHAQENTLQCTSKDENLMHFGYMAFN